jgi:hypothetical protein
MNPTDNWNDMTVDEQEYALSCIEELVSTGKSSLLDQLNNIDYRIPFPTIQQFLDDDYYAGKKSKDMFPLLRRDLIDIFEKDYEEVILTGSIGWGKSWIASFGLVYDFMKLLSMRDPHAYFRDYGAQLATGSRIVMMNLSVTGAQAHDMLYMYVVNLLKDMPWFKENYPNHNFKKDGLSFHSQSVFFKCGSSSEFGAIGDNIIGGALDEANFMIGARRSRRAQMAGEMDQAAVLYNQLSRRRTSRFMMRGGKLPCRFWLISSKQFPGDFLEKRINEINNAKNAAPQSGEDDIVNGKADPGNTTNVKIIDYSHWIPRKSLSGGGPYSGKNFLLFIGTAEHRSRIVADDASKVDKGTIEVPPGCHLIEVPIEYKKHFVEKLHESIKDIAGFSITAINMFFDRVDDLDECVCVQELGDVHRVHPYEFEETSVISPKLIKWELIPTTYDRKRDIIASAVNGGTRRYCHIDLSQTGDATGVAIGHYGGHKLITEKVEVPDLVTNGTKFIDITESRAITIMDFMMKFLPPIGGRIDIDKVRLIVKTLAERLGWVLAEVTYDQYQSANSINAWNSEQIKSYVFSVDRTSKPYEEFRASVYQKRFSSYKYAPLKKDIGSLDYNSRTSKVDHRAGGSKDVSDPVAAVVSHIERDYPAIRVHTEPSLGYLTSGFNSLQKNEVNMGRIIDSNYRSAAQAIQAYNDALRRGDVDSNTEFDPLYGVEEEDQ